MGLVASSWPTQVLFTHHKLNPASVISKVCSRYKLQPSSSSRPLDVLATRFAPVTTMGCCIVCYSADPPHRAAYEAAFFTCRHKEFACPKCWESYILQCLKTPSKPIECIQPGCNHLLTEQEISKRVSPETYFKLVSRVRLGEGLLELTRGRLTKVSHLNTVPLLL